MNSPTQLVVFILGDHGFALPLSKVERIIRVVEVTHLPKAPEIVIGVINMQGRIIPVVDIRKRFRLREKEFNLNDQLMILQTSRMPVGIVVDAVSGVVECPEQKVITADEILPGIEYVKGVVKIEGDIILIHDIDSFLSLEEEKTLDEVIHKL